jgi:catechol 2,3-dioxygenase-like lactoylglutathione lyase family enzyme
MEGLMRHALFGIVLAIAAASGVAVSGGPAAEVLGSGPIFHIVGDVDASAAFYRGLLGVPPPANATTRVFSPDPELQLLYNLPGGRESAAVVRVPGLGISLEFVEWRDVDRTPTSLRLQDPGASVLILAVRDVAATAAWLRQHGASIITPGGSPVRTVLDGVKGQALFARDPDGFFLELFQPDATQGASPDAAVAVTGLIFGVTVSDVERSARFFDDALGFHFTDTSGDNGRTWLSAAGLDSADSRQMTAQVPGSPLRLRLIEFTQTDRTPSRSSIQDPGTSMLQLSVRDITATVEALTAAGASVITVGGGSTLRHGNPISLLRGPDNLYLEPTQPPAQRPTGAN